MTERPVHWFHLWVGDERHPAAWHAPFNEHFATLSLARFDGDVRVGLVGDVFNRGIARHELTGTWPEARIEAQADEGYEQVTIEAMHAWSKTVAPDTPVFYSHGKGSFQPSMMNTRWRNAMDSLLVDFWQDRVEDLRTYDAVGLHWLTHEEFPEYINPRAPMFGGNYWWANAGYIASLPPVEGTPLRPPVNRYCAEGWVGRNFPKVRDLKPGWPLYADSSADPLIG